nr:helicase-related protein [Mucilaginibacter flavidus]
MVQNLCINYGVRQSPFLPDDRSAGFVGKVIASSATISRAAEQVKSLYGTDQLSIFPPQGLEFGNTWFSEEKAISDQFPARTYVGILGSGYPSIQASIIRSYAAVRQKVKELSDNEKIDYYWTLLGYFNSIRELGNASSLIYADVRERLSQLQNRELLPFTLRRKLFKSEELTSRISAFEIPEALKKLEKIFSNNHNQAIDICLATNMVATGVDISRLGLMFVHGQPKTTAEYIQASSRVGRDVPKGPGLIFTIYSPSKPRDKSLYENFQGYHMRIYAHVEPTSVTPYSINARQKGLHAVFIGLMRHLAEGNLRTNASTQGTDFQQLAVKVKELIIERCAISDPHELTNTTNKIDEIIHFWKGRFQNYGDAGNFKILGDEDYVPLMYASSAEVRDEIRKSSLSTPTSMRGVDSESRIVIVDQKL